MAKKILVERWEDIKGNQHKTEVEALLGDMEYRVEEIIWKVSQANVALRMLGEKATEEEKGLIKAYFLAWIQVNKP